MEDSIKIQTDKLVKTILESEVYQNYRKQTEKVSRIPELRNQINEYRTKRYELQRIEDESMLFDRMEEFDRQYELFEEDPIVGAYLAAELDFCRAVQEVNTAIIEALEFE